MELLKRLIKDQKSKSLKPNRIWSAVFFPKKESFLFKTNPNQPPYFNQVET